MQTTKKLALSGLLCALGVAASAFYIPIGASKCFPIQSLINVLSGVLLGPAYAVGIAFSTSTLRVALGTGSLLAYPGSMIGAFCCAMLYKHYKKLTFAFLGEVVGTGILGAVAAYPVVTLILSKKAALFTYVLPFMISSLGGAAIAIWLAGALLKTNIFEKFISR